MLRNTVQRSCAVNNVGAVNPDYRPAGEKFAQNVLRLFICGMIERGHQHNAVANVEVGVARRQTRLLATNRVPQRRGHRQLHDTERAAVLIAGS